MNKYGILICGMIIKMYSFFFLNQEGITLSSDIKNIAVIKSCVQ